MDASEFKSKTALDLTRETEHLSARERHPIDLAVTATRGCQVCTGSRMELALVRRRAVRLDHRRHQTSQ